jgi:hypothetical protein
MVKKSPISGFIPKLAWTGGIMVLVLALFLSYFNLNNYVKTQQNIDSRTVDVDKRDIVPEPIEAQKNYLKLRRDAVVDYLVVRNGNLNDYLASKY